MLWDILEGKHTVYSRSQMLDAGEICRSKDRSDFDEGPKRYGQMTGSRHLGNSKARVVLPVSSGEYLSTGPRRDKPLGLWMGLGTRDALSYRTF